MDPAIVAAIVAGVFGLLAAFGPALVKRKRDSRAAADTPRLSAGDGLSSVVGIVQRGPHVLIVRRKTRIGNLSWQFPAGVVKPGANPQDRIEDEVLDETGVTCQFRRMLGARVHPDTKVLCNYVLCAYLDGIAENRDPEENSDVRWIHAREVADYVTSDIFVPIRGLLQAIAADPSQRASLGIVVREAKVLLVQTRLADGQHVWRFPGGSVEQGEADDVCAVREVAEETGVECAAGKRLGDRVHPQTGQLLSYWACAFVAGEATLREPQHFSAVEWVETRKALELLGDEVFPPVKQHLLEAG